MPHHATILGADTHMQTFMDRSNSKKPGEHWPQTSAHLVKNFHGPLETTKNTKI